ncbi:MAG: helix-turn-helix domain-containing protein [Planctomycetota bacterium]
MKPTKTNCKKLTVPEVARQYGVNQSKVLAWIAEGELLALNVASTRATRPRWRIDPDDLAAFEESRRSTALCSEKPRRRKLSQTQSYYD